MTVRFCADHAGHAEPAITLFIRTFSASEGVDEGVIIGDVVRDLLQARDRWDVRLFVALEEAGVIGGCLLSRLVFPDDARKVYLLSPVAVAPERQGRGVGQVLLRHALQALRDEGADVVATYGDPGFYGKVGFAPVSIGTLPAPHPLSQPEGWLAQSLIGAALTPFAGQPRCAGALDNPALW